MEIANACRKGQQAYFALKTREHFNPEIIWIYRLYTRSGLLSILYSCELWYDLRTKDMHDLNTLPHFIYKDAMGLPKSTDICGFGSDIFESLLWLLSMSSKIDKRKLELLGRLFNLETKTPIKIFLYRPFSSIHLLERKELNIFMALSWHYQNYDWIQSHLTSFVLLASWELLP